MSILLGNEFPGEGRALLRDQVRHQRAVRRCRRRARRERATTIALWSCAAAMWLGFWAVDTAIDLGAEKTSVGEIVRTDCTITATKHTNVRLLKNNEQITRTLGRAGRKL